MGIHRIAWTVVAGCVVALALAGCATSAGDRSVIASTWTSTPHPTGQLPAPTSAAHPVVWSHVGALSLPLPRAWRLYRVSPSMTLDPDAEAIVTDEPIRPGCLVALGRIEPDRCPRGGPVTRQSPGGVFAFVTADDQVNGRVEHQTATIDGYAAKIVTDAKPTAGFCPVGATRMGTATLMAPAGTQPADVEIDSCVGGSPAQAAATEHDVAAMVAGARIASRPVATTAITGARRCTGADLVVTQGPMLSPATQERLLMFAVRNMGERACRLAGYPTIELLGRSGTLPFGYRHGVVQDPGPARAIYLEPGGYGFFDVSTDACVLAGSIPVDRIRIVLPGQGQVTTLPAASRGRQVGGMAFCEHRAVPGPFDVVGVGALSAY